MPIGEATGGKMHPKLPTVAAEDLDAQSIVVLRGCILGWNRQLLEHIKKMFGGRSRVYGCFCTIKYRNRQETLLDEFDFHLGGANHSMEAIKAGLAAHRLALAKFKEEQDPGVPSYAEYTQADWDELAATTSSNTDDLIHRGVSVATVQFWDPKNHPTFDEKVVLDQQGNPKSQEQLAQVAREHWSSGAKAFDSYQWGTWSLTQVTPRKPIDAEHYQLASYRLDGTGVRTNYEYRRAVLDPRTQAPAISNIDNPRHFRFV